MLAAVALQGAEHLLRQRISKGSGLIRGGNNVVHGRHRSLRTTHLQPLVFQGNKCLRARHLVDQMQPNQQLGRATREFRNAMEIPNFVVQGSAAHSHSTIHSKP